MKSLDCRNLACPAPVIAAKRALDDAAGTPVQIIVDAGAARENVSRFAVSRGYQVQETDTDNGVILTIGGNSDTPVVPTARAARCAGAVVLVGSDRLGDGPEELGRLLMKNFIITLLDLETPPERLLFLNSGVHMTTEGSEVLEALEALGNRGVEVMSCGVCLDYFHKKDQLRAGVVTNMYTIADSLMTTAQVVRL